ncbi:MAG: hypothetical protein OHK0046_40680 [Anaerolineae bacterium]
MSWRLWRELQDKSRLRGLYRRFIVPGEAAETKHQKRKTGTNLLIGLVSAFVFASCVVPSFITFVCFIPWLLGIAGTTCGLILSVKSARLIAIERQQGRYDLVSMSPLGNMAWRITQEIYHYSPSIWDIAQAVLWMTRLVGVVGAFIWVVMLLSGNNLATYTGLLVVLVGLYIDLVHSVVVGALVGILTPSYAPEPTAARLLAFSTYLMVQFAFYAVFGLVAGSVVPDVFPESGIGTILLQLLVFYALREAIIGILYVFLEHRIEDL